MKEKKTSDVIVSGPRINERAAQVTVAIRRFIPSKDLSTRPAAGSKTCGLGSDNFHPGLNSINDCHTCLRNLVSRSQPCGVIVS